MTDEKQQAERSAHAESFDGLLLVGHGTRDAHGLNEARTLARLTAKRLPGVAVQLCFLELAEPDISAGVARLVDQGVRRLTVMPLLLFSAGHAKRDIPRQVEMAANHHPQLHVEMAGHLGLHPRVLELSALRHRQTVSGAPPVAEQDTLLLLVGRGSRDDESRDEMTQFAALRRKEHESAVAPVCFVAMSRPLLPEGLAEAANSGKQRIVVQSHLLFAGELVRRVSRHVNDAAQRHGGLQWLVTQHLGAHELLADAIVDIAGGNFTHSDNRAKKFASNCRI